MENSCSVPMVMVRVFPWYFRNLFRLRLSNPADGIQFLFSQVPDKVRDALFGNIKLVLVRLRHFFEQPDNRTDASYFKKISMISPFTSNVNGPARQVSGLMVWIEHLFPLQKMQVPSLRAGPHGIPSTQRSFPVFPAPPAGRNSVRRSGDEHHCSNARRSPYK